MISDLFTPDDCLKDENVSTFSNTPEGFSANTERKYYFAENFDPFPKNKNTYVFSTFCLNISIRSIYNFRNIDNLKCVFAAMSSYLSHRHY